MHGRTKEQRGAKVGDADWDAIAAVRKAVGIPVIANGNIRCFEDIERCMAATGCAGVMSAWTLLREPRLFAGPRPQPKDELEDELRRAREWLEFAAKYEGRGATLRRSKVHLFKRLYATMLARPLLREHLSLVNTYSELDAFLHLLDQSLADPDCALPPLPVKEKKPEEDVSDDCWVLFES